MKLRAVKTFRDSGTQPPTGRKPGEEYETPDHVGKHHVKQGLAIELPAGGVAAPANKEAGEAPGRRPSRAGRAGKAGRSSSSRRVHPPRKRKPS